MRRLVLGAHARTRVPRNAAVEWRLVESAGATAAALRPTLLRPRRWSMPAFALAALIELALLFGAIYSVRTHLAHVHHEPVDASIPH
ncbi:MAG TPA: hypothetical protein VMW56_30875 [Candidatus Margulisiibacteriota bacterium]|nr:hypothetical protein [Candidatus Margulisiibacteriota bacterium]